MEIVTERVQMPVPGAGQMGGYLARPKDGTPRPAVVVYMEIFGINSHIRDVTERVAREGYTALAPDYFHRTGPGVEYGYDAAGMEAGIKLLSGLTAEGMIADARAAIAWLRTQPEVLVQPEETCGEKDEQHRAQPAANARDPRAHGRAAVFQRSVAPKSARVDRCPLPAQSPRAARFEEVRYRAESARGGEPWRS